MEMEQLIRPEIKDDWGILELQNCLLNIAKYIHEFCEENDIQYCIMGGTALGAIRHGGFIPWDDDLDLFMTLDNYAKFRELFWEKGDREQFYLQELGKNDGLPTRAKLRMNGTSFIEEMTKDLDIHQGIFVDIMLMENYPDNSLSRKWMLLWTKYIYIKSAAELNYNRRGKCVKIALIPFKLLPKKFLYSYAVSQIRKYKQEKCKNYFHYYFRMPLSHSIYPKELFDEYILIDFETIKLRVPKGVKKYLEILFGDYMKIPNIEDIRFRQHTQQWSLNIPFEKKGKGLYEDENYY